MPYKHIAAHLKKTELACRLHYHQLSHGSNRRKRTTSMSSSSSSTGHSPIMLATIPSPIHESPSRSVSPAGSSLGYGASVQLPSIMSHAGSHLAHAAAAAAHHHPHHAANSPRLPAILPKPANMSLALSSARYASLQDHAQQQPQQQLHSAPLLPSASFSSAAATGPLRLDCAAAVSSSSSSSSSQPAVDMARLHAVYSAHRTSFWSAVAADYGAGMHPSVLEQAWRSGSTGSSITSASGSSTPPAPAQGSSATGYMAAAPITPIGSPDDREYGKQNKTRISAILGIDANPRSPKERDLVRRMEEERAMVGVGA